MKIYPIRNLLIRIWTKTKPVNSRKRLRIKQEKEAADSDEEDMTEQPLRVDSFSL